MNFTQLKVIFGLIVLLSGCSTRPEGDAAIASHPWEATLATNPRLPHELLRQFYSDEQWKEVSQSTYSAYVTFDAYVNPDRTLRLRGVREAYPDLDPNRIKMAERMSESIRLSPVTVGTRVPPSANVHIIFYEFDGDIQQVMVYAVQRAGAAATTHSGGDTYMTVFTLGGKGRLVPSTLPQGVYERSAEPTHR